MVSPSGTEDGPKRPAVLYDSTRGWAASASMEAQEKSALEHVRANQEALRSRARPEPQTETQADIAEAPEKPETGQTVSSPDAKLEWSRHQGPDRQPTVEPTRDRPAGFYDELKAVAPAPASQGLEETPVQAVTPRLGGSQAEHEAVASPLQEAGEVLGKCRRRSGKGRRKGDYRRSRRCWQTGSNERTAPPVRVLRRNGNIGFRRQLQRRLGAWRRPSATIADNNLNSLSIDELWQPLDRRGNRTWHRRHPVCPS